MVQNFQGEPKWLDGTVTEQTGPVFNKVLVGDQHGYTILLILMFDIKER